MDLTPTFGVIKCHHFLNFETTHPPMSSMSSKFPNLRPPTHLIVDDVILEWSLRDVELKSLIFSLRCKDTSVVICACQEHAKLHFKLKQVGNRSNLIFRTIDRITTIQSFPSQSSCRVQFPKYIHYSFLCNARKNSFRSFFDFL